jgi:hypothetical protein
MNPLPISSLDEPPDRQALFESGNRQGIAGTFEVRRSWAEIPPDVAEWLHAKLRCMIGPDGHRAHVADAIEDLSARVRNLIAAQANTIGEERRLVRLSGTSP